MRISGGETRHFYYNQQWQVLEERVGTSTTADKQYVYHPHYVDAIAMSRDASGTEHFYLQDANFNVTAVVDNLGAVVERYAYTPYGEVTVLDTDFSPDPDNISDIANELLYTGRRTDPETGLQLNRNRFYTSQLGRWVNRDPIGYGGGANMYEYVGSSATISYDPSGLHLVNEFSRGGDDEARTHETARIFANIETEGECDEEDCGECVGELKVKLKYTALLRGNPMGNSGHFGIFQSKPGGPGFDKFDIKQNPLRLERTVDLGSLACKGGNTKGRLAVGLPTNRPTYGGLPTRKDHVNGLGRLAQYISYKVTVEECGSVSADVKIIEIPTPRGQVNGQHPHPIRCVTCGEDPYPPLGN